jgi:hypothetical protein
MSKGTVTVKARVDLEVEVGVWGAGGKVQDLIDVAKRDGAQIIRNSFKNEPSVRIHDIKAILIMGLEGEDQDVPKEPPRDAIDIVVSYPDGTELLESQPVPGGPTLRQILEAHYPNWRPTATDNVSEKADSVGSAERYRAAYKHYATARQEFERAKAQFENWLEGRL